MVPSTPGVYSHMRFIPGSAAPAIGSTAPRGRIHVKLWLGHAERQYFVPAAGREHGGVLGIRLLTGSGGTHHYQLDSDSGSQLPDSA